MRATRETTLRTSEIPRTYEGLLKLHMLRPIHDEVELINATEVMDALAGHPLNPAQEDYLDVLSTLVDEYEKAHHPVDEKAGNGLRALRFLLNENGMNASDLARLLGCHRSLGAKILAGERALTLSHICALCRRFKVRADLFLRV